MASDGVLTTTGVRRRSATIREVAEDAGVSTATVSRVFSGGARVTEDVSQRVRDAARRLNYLPSRLARSLRVRQTRYGRRHYP